MRVLHVNDYRASGGCEVVVEMTMSLLQSRGIEVDLLTGDEIKGHRRTPLSYIESSVCKRALAERLAAYQPDAIHLHNFYHTLSPGILAVLESYCKQHSARTVMTAHDHHLLCPNSGMCHYQRGRMQPADASRLASVAYLLTHRWDDRSIAHSLLKVLQHVWNYRLHKRRRVIDCVLCPSRYLKRMLDGLGMPTQLLPFPAPRSTSVPSKPDGPLRMVFSGRVEPEKGLAEFLESLPESFAGTLTIVGEGTELDRCRDICTRRGIQQRVEFVGLRPHDETMSIIGASHLLVLGSLCAENYPMSVLEALSLGTNILVSNFGGTKEIVQASGVGFMFDPLDPESVETSFNDVTASFERGELNQFDVSAFLAQRSEANYVAGLLSAYRGERASTQEKLGPAA